MTTLFKVKTFFIAIFILLVSVKYTYASHVSGGEVTYTSLGNNQYKVQLVIYWDCSSFDPGTSQSMNTSNTCGFSNVNFIVDRDTTYNASPTCSGSSSTCAGGTLPGNNKNIYSAIITLPGACSSWTFYHESCCRNISTNVPTQPSYTFYATLNNQIAPSNNSPYFTSEALPYLCVGVPVCYGPGVIDIDGNTLSYSLINAMDTDPSTPVTYAGGYSGSSPIPGITMDPNTGLISFTPSSVGNYVVCFQVIEKNSSGIIIGSVIRDLQIIAVNCSNPNHVISCNSGSINNLIGNGAISTGPNSFQICENIPFSFTTSFTDPDSTDILSYTSNVLQVLPGASISSSGTNPITISISWTAPPGSANWNTTFAITASDNACPYTGEQTVNYSIDVQPSANAGPDQITCGNIPVQLNANGSGNVYTWSVLNGPPIIIGTNFSCNPCQNPIAFPASTTTYLLTCNGGNGCMNTDTVIVNVVSDFSFDLNQSSAATCLNSPVQLEINNIVPQTIGYSYQWSPAVYLDNVSIANPIATISVPGTYNYIATVTSPSGCIKKDTLQVVANGITQPIATSSNTNACPGSTVALGVNFGNGVSGSCGINTSGTCNGGGNSIQIGNGTSTNSMTGYPAPYGNYYTSAKHQFLYTAAELTAAGLVSGKIDALSFSVLQVNGITTYHNYNIRLGCTNLTSFTSGTLFQTSLYDVYPNQAHNVTLGWNSHEFSNVFEWDGNSNIVVEISFTEGPPDYTYTNNCISEYTTTPFVSCLYYRNDAAPYAASSTTVTPTSSSDRPNIKFHNCSSLLSTSNFIYSWSPTTGLSDPNSQTTNALVPGAITYNVTVTDTITGCIASDSIQIDLCTEITNKEFSEILIYPSPVTDVLKISNPDRFVLDYMIYDITGKTVIMKSKSENSLIELNTSLLEDGIYILQLSYKDKSKYYKIIKQ